MNFVKKSSFANYLTFSPLLLLYVIFVFSFSSDELVADEARHLIYAQNLTEGYYAEKENPEIGNGPGYPILITPFVFVNMSNHLIKQVNSILMIMAVLLFFKTVLFYLKSTHALLASYLFGLYPAFMKWMVFLHSESFAVFLSCGFIYYSLKVFKTKSKKKFDLFAVIFFLGVLALTKVIVAYVILCLLLGYFLFYIFTRNKKSKKLILILAGSFMFCIPFLTYTYMITGKSFYWGTQGGEILYWRSSPFPKEYGDWVSKDVILGQFEEKDYYDVSDLIKNHGTFITKLEAYSVIQRDSMYHQQAMLNIKNHPEKFIKNTGASFLRLFFNYPYSYTPQKISSYFYILPNAFLFVFLFSSIYLIFRNRSAIPFEIYFFGFTSIVFIGGLSLLDGRTRHLLPILPLLFVCIIYIHNKFISINITHSR